MENNNINYKKFVEDWAEVTYGCSVCKYKNTCPVGDVCNFVLEFEKLIKEVNEDQLEPISYNLVKKDYYI